MTTDIADIISQSYDEKSQNAQQNIIIPLNTHLPFENGKNIYLNEEITDAYELFNFLVRQDSDFIVEISRKLTTSTTKEIVKNVIKDPIGKRKIEHEHQALYYKKQRFALHIIRSIHGKEASNVSLKNYLSL